jgi:hypothetical protein
MFSASTPRLMLVLRSFVLPNLEEDMNESFRKLRKMPYMASTYLHLHSNTTKLILADLPVKKLRSSY